MKKLLIGIGVLALVVVLVIAGALAFLTLKKPAMRPPSAEKIEVTPERVARGRYIAEHLSGCIGCHSDAVPTRFGLPRKPGTEGQGGIQFEGMPGRIAARNITPDPETGIGRWSDGELLRAIREGVDRDGRALFPMMQYPYYHGMSDEDARSIVAYLRSLKPIKNPLPPNHVDFPVSLFIKSAPRPVEGPIATPDDARDHLAYGRYLVTIAACRECHTPHDDHGQLLPGTEFSGGWEMYGPWGRVVTANITPHPKSWVGKATKAEFIGRFKSFAGLDAETSPETPKGKNTVMGWLEYSGLTEQDLGAIYDYLRTLTPIEHAVESFPDAPGTTTLAVTHAASPAPSTAPSER